MPDIFIAPNKNKDTNKSLVSSLGAKAKLFSAFSFMPEDLHFNTQEPGETVILFIRAHFVSNFSWLFTGLLLLITPFFLFPVISDPTIFPIIIPPNYILFAELLWYMATFSFLFVQFILWYFTISIVTTERIIDIDFDNLLHKDIAETRITRVEDVDSQTGGFIPSLFDYGDVFVQTAGTAENFEFLKAPHPQQIVKIINQLVGKEEENG